MSEPTNGADAPAPLPELTSPEVPQKLSYAQELEKALGEMGSPKAQVRDAKYKGKAKAEEPEAEEAAPEAKPEEKKPEPVTQEKLSSGFAKLERQRKAVARAEAALKEREDKIASMQAEFEKTSTEKTSALEAKEADVTRLLKLYDEDEEACLEELAKRRNSTKEAFYDRLTRKRLNGGVTAPEDQIAGTNKEIEAVRKELAELKAAKQAEEDAAKKAKEEAQALENWQKAIAQENAGFVKHIREGAAKYPLLADEKDEDIVSVARRVVGDAKGVTYEDVAAYLEKQLTLQKAWEEQEAAKAAQATETPKKSAPPAEGKKPEPAKAKTITNKMQATRTPKSESTPLTDDQRLDRALAAWK